MYIQWLIGQRIKLTEQADIAELMSRHFKHRPYHLHILDYEHGAYLFVGLRIPGESFVHPEYGLSKDMMYLCDMLEQVEEIKNLPWLNEFPTEGSWSHPEMLLIRD